MFSARLTPVVRLVVVDLLGSFFHFPVWWYTTGLKRVTWWFLQTLRYRWHAYAMGVWWHNLLVPMYGQYNLSGRLISLGMRVVVLFGRLIAILIEGLLYIAGLILWLAAPIAFTFLLLINLGSIWSPRFL